MIKLKKKLTNDTPQLIELNYLSFIHILSQHTGDPRTVIQTQTHTFAYSTVAFQNSIFMALLRPDSPAFSLSLFAHRHHRHPRHHHHHNHHNFHRQI